MYRASESGQERRTGFVAHALDGDFARAGEVHAEDLAVQLVEILVVVAVQRIRRPREGDEAIALVLLLCDTDAWVSPGVRTFRGGTSLPVCRLGSVVAGGIWTSMMSPVSTGQGGRGCHVAGRD